MVTHLRKFHLMFAYGVGARCADTNQLPNLYPAVLRRVSQQTLTEPFATAHFNPSPNIFNHAVRNLSFAGARFYSI